MSLTKVSYSMIQNESADIANYGADSTGATDSAVAIQAALNSGAKSVYIPDGSFKTSVALTIPDGVTVYGNGYSSQVFSANAINVFLTNNNVTIDNIRISSTYGDVAPFNSGSGVYVNNSNNVTVKNCYIDGHGSCGVQVTGTSCFTNIQDNLFVGNIGGSGSTIASNNSDICFYTPIGTPSFGFIITGNKCLSDNSQGIYLSALNGNSETICSNNICIVCDTSLAYVSTPTWRRHGIVASYNGGRESRLIISNNVIRNTNWTGIYVQSGVAVSGPTIIQGNMISRTGIANYPISGSLSGGILVGGLASSGTYISDNVIEDHREAGTGGINIVAAYALYTVTPIVVQNNQILNSQGYGIRFAGYSIGVKVDGNFVSNSVKNDIYCAPGSNTYDLGVWDIINNKVIRDNALYNPVWLDNGGNTMIFNVENNTLKGIDNTTNAEVNAGIHTRGSVLLNSTIKNNYIKKFYRGVNHVNYIAAGTRYFSEFCIDYNVFDQCAIGIGLTSTDTTTTVPVEGNRFVNCSSDIGLSTLNGAACLYIAKRNRTTLEIETAASPTTGTWIVGDKSWNTAAASGGAPGWVCTTAGTSGTWKAMANLA